MELTEEEKIEARKLKDIWKYNKIIRCPLCKNIYGCDLEKHGKECPDCLYKINIKNNGRPRKRWLNTTN